MRSVFQTEWFIVEEEPVANVKNCNEEFFYRIRTSDSVLILPINTEGKVVLVRQYRQSIKKDTLEFPAGFIEKGESAEQAARRELLEETGYIAAQMKPLGRLRPMINRFNYSLYGYLALDLEMESMDSKIEKVEVGVQSFYDLVKKGSFFHAEGLAFLNLVKVNTDLNIFDYVIEH